METLLIVLGVFVAIIFTVGCATMESEGLDWDVAAIKYFAIILLVAATVAAIVWGLVRIQDPSFANDFFTLKTGVIALAVIVFLKIL